MIKGNTVVVALLSLFTLGIYASECLVQTKREMCSRGADIPPALLVILPFVNIY